LSLIGRKLAVIGRGIVRILAAAIVKEARRGVFHNRPSPAEKTRLAAAEDS